MNKSLLNFFPKDFEPTTGQVQIIKEVNQAFNEDYKFCIVSAPTGTGKSFVSKTLSNASNNCTDNFKKLVNSYEAFKQDGFGNYLNSVSCEEEPPFGCFTLTITKSLQDQYKSLFSDIKILKGKNNYICEIDQQSPVDAAPCLLSPKVKEQCWECNKCSYYNERNIALTNKDVVLNYKMFLNLPSHLKRKNYIVCDEASELENELVKTFSIQIDTLKLLKQGIKVSPLKDHSYRTVKEWLSLISLNISEYVESLIKKNTSNPNLVLGVKNRINNLKYLFWQINTCLEEWKNCEWVIDQQERHIVNITPLTVNTLSRHIFDYADQIVLMSATIIDHKKFAESLGIKKYKYIEAKSNFNPKSSPIFLSKSYSLNYTNKQKVLPLIAKQIVEICNFYKDKKGIIHTHNLDITETLQKILKHKRFLFRSDIKTNDDILDKHFNTSDPTVLVSPSLTHGVDLKDDLARFCIIVKLPYLPLSNKRIKQLFESNKEWYENQMLNVLVQMCGRSTRSKNDFSTTYILDGNGFRVLPKAKHKLPSHFFDRIE